MIKRYRDINSDENAWGSYFESRNMDYELEMTQTLSSTRILEKFLTPDAKILDAGCGAGRFSSYFLSKGYKNIIGIDCMEAAIKLCRRQGIANVLKGDIRKLFFKEKSFDAVISQGVVEHLEEGPLNAFIEARRVLKEGGLFFCSVPYPNLIRKVSLLAKRLGLPLENAATFFDEYWYEKRELKSYLTQAGFDVCFIKFIDFDVNNRSFCLGVKFPRLFHCGDNTRPFDLNKKGTILKSVINHFPILCYGSIMAVSKRGKEDRKYELVP